MILKWWVTVKRNFILGHCDLWYWCSSSHQVGRVDPGSWTGESHNQLGGQVPGVRSTLHPWDVEPVIQRQARKRRRKRWTSPSAVPLCTTDKGSLSLRGVEPPLQPPGPRWSTATPLVPASAGVLVVIEPVHGSMVLSVAVMLRLLVLAVLRWMMSFVWVIATVEKSIRILWFYSIQPG